jgi:hypothetical protein
MKKFLPLWLFITLLFCLSARSSFAQVNQIPAGHLKTTVQATVGQYYFSFSGYLAPNASIVLTIDGIFIRATTADQYGNFSISDVLIKPGFSHFCVEGIDFRRLGSSYTCFDIPPAIGSVTMKDVFLSPTLGLSRTEIAEGSTAKAFGYSMPGALVTLFVNGKTFTTHADKTGYYEFLVKGLKAGQYSVYARASLNNKQSVEPTRKLQLKSLSIVSQTGNFFKDLWDKLLKFLTNLALGPLWLLIPIIILIIILLVKLWPGGFRNPLKNQHPLHHKWWMGY